MLKFMSSFTTFLSVVAPAAPNAQIRFGNSPRCSCGMLGSLGYRGLNMDDACFGHFSLPDCSWLKNLAWFSMG